MDDSTKEITGYIHNDNTSIETDVFLAVCFSPKKKNNNNQILCLRAIQKVLSKYTTIY